MRITRMTNKKTKRMLEIEEKFGEDIGVLLGRWYWTDWKTTREIGEVCGVYYSTIMRWVGKFNIKKRKGNTILVDKPTKEELYELHIKQRKNTMEMGRIYGVSRKPIERLLVKLGVGTINKWGNPIKRGYCDRTLSKEEIAYLRRFKLPGIGISINSNIRIYFGCSNRGRVYT